MKSREDRTVVVAEMLMDAAAVGDAVLALDPEEARFGARLLAANAHAAGFTTLALGGRPVNL